MARRFAFLLPLLLAACADGGGPASLGPPPPPPGAITLQAPSPLWAGAEVTVTSARFAAEDIAATMLRLGTTPVPLTRRDATTLVGVVPPDMLSNGVVPHVTHGGTTTDFPVVTVYGYAERATYDLTLPWDVAVLPDPAHAKVMAGYMGNTPGLAIIDLETKTVTTLPGAIDVTGNQRGPGETREPGIWLMREPGTSGSLPMHRWRLTGIPTDLGVVPAPSGQRQIAHFGADLWLTSTAHAWSLGRFDGGEAPPVTPPLTGQSEEIGGIHLSPDGTRATFRVNRDLAGVPVFDAVAGTIAYRTAFMSAEGVAFQGTELLMAGSDLTPARTPTLHLLRAADGVVLAGVPLTLPVSDVALDPRRPFAYVLVNGPDGLPVVEVRDRTTLALRGTLKVPAGAGASCGVLAQCLGGKLVISPGDGGLYFFWAWNGPTRAYRFALPAP